MQLNTLKKKSLINLKNVHPELKKKVLLLITDLYNEEGVGFAVFMGYRTQEEQAALYAQGRDPLRKVNLKRKKVGYYALSPKENRRKVTGLRYSWHNSGLAVDIVEDSNLMKPGIQWSWKNIKHYLLIGKYVKKHGLVWGGFWKSFKDYPHLQLPCKYTRRQVQEKHQGKGLEALWKKIY